MHNIIEADVSVLVQYILLCLVIQEASNRPCNQCISFRAKLTFLYSEDKLCYTFAFIYSFKIVIFIIIPMVFSSPEPKAHCRAYRICRPPSSVCRPHSLNNLSLKTTGPIEARGAVPPMYYDVPTSKSSLEDKHI